MLDHSINEYLGGCTAFDSGQVVVYLMVRRVRFSAGGLFLVSISIIAQFAFLRLECAVTYAEYAMQIQTGARATLNTNKDTRSESMLFVVRLYVEVDSNGQSQNSIGHRLPLSIDNGCVRWNDSKPINRIFTERRVIAL